MTLILNTSNGPRGAYVGGNLVMVEPGATIEADDFCEEWFEELDENDDGLSKLSVAKLKDLAADEKIDLGDATKKADIIAAIQLGREAKQD